MSDSDVDRMLRVVVMRHAVIMEDEGRQEFIGTFPDRAAADAWIMDQAGEYFRPCDYFVVEGK